MVIFCQIFISKSAPRLLEAEGFSRINLILVEQDGLRVVILQSFYMPGVQVDYLIFIIKHFAHMHIYVRLGEGPGVNREKKLKKNIFKKISFFIAFNTPRPPLSVQKKFQPNRSSRLAGYWQHIFIRMSCLIIKNKDRRCSWPNVWTELAEIWNPWVPWG